LHKDAIELTKQYYKDLVFSSNFIILFEGHPLCDQVDDIDLSGILQLIKVG